MQFLSKRNYLLSIITSSILFTGCGGGGGGNSDTSLSNSRTKRDIKVYSLGPALNATVKDSDGNLATQKILQKIYILLILNQNYQL